MELDDFKVFVVKNRILDYERQFKLAHHRKPTKQDIQQDQKMLKYYKVYWKCKSSPSTPTTPPDTTISTTSPPKPADDITSRVVNVAPGVWAKGLNKQPKSATTGDNELDRFKSVSSKVQRLNEDHYREEAKSNKQMNYSLRLKRQNVELKSKEAAAQAIKPKPSALEQDAVFTNMFDTEPAFPVTNHQEPLEPFPDIPDPSPPRLPSPPCLPPPVPHIEKPEPQVSAFSLLKSMAEGTSVCNTDNFDYANDFSLDELNASIQNAIIEPDLICKIPNSSNNSDQSKKRIFDVDDDGLFESRKRFCTAAPISNESSNDSNDVALVSADDSSDNPGSTRKFFKNRDVSKPAYNLKNHFDHNKGCEFDFPDDDTDKDKTYVPDKSDKGNNKLANVTNKNLNTEKSKKQPKAAKKPNDKANFRRLNMKKSGARVRGYKKFNMKRYKYKNWKSNKAFKKHDNKCFKCGESDHWANACPNVISSLPTTIEENLIESGLENENVHQTFNTCLEAPLFSDVDDPELDQLVEEALTEFGFEEFRPHQKLAIKRILCSKSTLLVAPTGSGKSLCYQLAAYCFWKKRGLITIVVSPLISLMQDQIANFPPILKPVAINSNLSEQEKESAINAIIDRKAQVLFLSPECVVSGLHSINFNAFARVAFVCIDEAHCLAEWSTNFRPSYLHLYKVLRYKLNIKTILAMTATVTKETTRIICKNLKLDPSLDVVGSTRVPENLVLTISKKSNKVNALIELLRSEPFASLKSIIIYCTRREQTQQLETQIRTLLQFDTPQSKVNNLIRAYHAGLGAYERTNVQKQFISGKLRIVVATIAFGMGINKKDIRGIIHFNMPKSFENYIQEIGRAGRDGQPAYCHLFLDNEGEDLFSLQNYIYANGVDKPNLRRLVSKIYNPCKCNLLATSAEESEDSSQTALERSLTCKGHPVAVPIASTEIEIDLKSESIYTLLMSLEMNWAKAPIQVCAPTNSACTLVNFGDESDMYDLVKKSPIIQIGATLAKQESKSAFDFSNFKFSAVKVAAMLGMDVNQVKSDLKRLEWVTDPTTGRKKKSHVAIRFSDYSYLVRAPGNLSETDIEEVTNFLYDSIEQYESKEIYKIRFIYTKFDEFVLPDQSSSFSIEVNSNRLKLFINDYFQLESGVLPAVLDTSKLNLPFTFDIQNQDLASISLVICEFLHYHHREGVNTPRKIARILQGISSPKYPAEIWGKVRKYWRSQGTIDFKHLMELCRKGLMDTYTIQKASSHPND